MRQSQIGASVSCETAISELQNNHPGLMANWIHSHLFEHVLPFWQRHAIDEEGGLFTCIADNGEIQSTEKWIWSQWRAVWVFSRIYRTLDQNTHWLSTAKGIAEFCYRHAWDRETGHWALLVSREGRVLRGYESTYVDAFAVYGLTELYLATGDKFYADIARKTATAAQLALQMPYDRIAHFPYPIPAGAKPHGIPMLWSLKFAELGAALKDEEYLTVARRLSDEIFSDFLQDDGLCREFVTQAGKPLRGRNGSVVVPGHVIEDMWFQIHIARMIGGGGARTELACRLIRSHLETGWEPTYGGITLAIDTANRGNVEWPHANTKLWWPHTEALYATVLAAVVGPERNLLMSWYKRIWEFCLKNFVDWENGEWRQKLHHDLSPFRGTIALPVKDPFHLPRSLILQLELLNGEIPTNPECI